MQRVAKQRSGCGTATIVNESRIETHLVSSSGIAQRSTAYKIAVKSGIADTFPVPFANTMPNDVKTIASRFDIPGNILSCEPYGNGHINDTFLVLTDSDDQFILQRVNHHVFKKPTQLMENVFRVTEHIRAKMQMLGRDPDRHSLTLVPTLGGDRWLTDDENTWRLYLFIRDSVGHDIVKSPGQALEGGRAFGEFQRLLTDLPGGPLYDTIPRFHDMELRLQNFRNAVEADLASRANAVTSEISWIETRAFDMTKFLRLGRDGQIAARITHNDTKFNNVLLDAKTDSAVCVIDLDTVMPGLVLYDFGDSIRTVTNSAAEDEEDTSKVHVDIELFRGYAKGYLSEAYSFLSPVEIENLAFSGIVMTFIIGLRFITDYLEGDHYFKIHRPDHNIVRARTQFALVESMEENLGEMNRIVEDYVRHMENK